MYRPSELHFMSDTLLMISLKNDFDPYSSNNIIGGNHKMCIVLCIAHAEKMHVFHTICTTYTHSTLALIGAL